MKKVKERRLIGDYGSGNTFTIHKGKDNSGNETIRIGATDDSTTGLMLLIIPFFVIYLGIELVKYITNNRREKKANKAEMDQYVEDFYNAQSKKHSKNHK